jgi:putative RNA 2'-phosphotransferase
VTDRLTKLSKRLSYALRHRPEEFELELDADGWVPVEQVVDGTGVALADIEAIMATSPRQRFELRDGRIRAHYGHTVPGRIVHEPEPAPGTLYHGTPSRALPGIRDKGLLPRKRQYVHLARGPELAVTIGERREAQPVVLEVDGAAATAAGLRFYKAGPEIVLTEHVPVEFIRFP